MKAKRTHYLISTHQIPGVYNLPFHLPNPSAKEIELRNARPLSQRSRQRLKAQLHSDATEILKSSRNVKTLSRESKTVPLPPISMKTSGQVQVRLCILNFGKSVHILHFLAISTMISAILKQNTFKPYLQIL